MSLNEGDNALCELRALLAREANQDDAGGFRPGNVDEPSKVLVFGQEYPVLSVSKVDDALVTGSRSHVRNGDNVVTFGSKSADDCKVAAFVRKESHSRALRLA